MEEAPEPVEAPVPALDKSNRSSTRLSTNLLANLIRAMSAGLGVFVLPPTLVRVLTHDVYSAWALVLQIASYIALLDLGLQVGIGRFVARENAQQNHQSREHYFVGGTALLLLCSAIAFVATLLLAALFPFLFPRVDPSLVGPVRIAVLLIGGSTALGLPTSAIVALFIGLERFFIPTAVIATGRVVQIVAVSVIGIETKNLVAIAGTFAACNLATQVGYLYCLNKFAPRMHFHRSKLISSVIREIVDYCANVSVWTFSMLLVSGLDVAIVAEVDFKAVAQYSICANVITALVGFLSSGLGVLIPRSAALDGVSNHKAVGQLLLHSTQVTSWILVGIGCAGAALAGPLLRIWVGGEISATGTAILQLLIAANTLRLLMTPYATILLGTGEQKWARWTALCEGVVNLTASIWLGRQFGAIGVAIGTMIGSGIGVALALGYSLPRTKRIACSVRDLFLHGLILPISLQLPVMLAATVYYMQPSLVNLLILAISYVVSVALTLKLGPTFLREILRRGLAKIGARA